MHSCSSMGYLARSMSQATVEVILSDNGLVRSPGARPAPGSWQPPDPTDRDDPAPPRGAPAWQHHLAASCTGSEGSVPASG